MNSNIHNLPMRLHFAVDSGDAFARLLLAESFATFTSLLEVSALSPAGRAWTQSANVALQPLVLIFQYLVQTWVAEGHALGIRCGGHASFEVCNSVEREAQQSGWDRELKSEREAQVGWVLNLSAAARFTCCSVIGNGWLVQEGKRHKGEWHRNWERSFFAWVCFINKLFAQLAGRVVQLSRRREPAGREKLGAGYKFTCKIGCCRQSGMGHESWGTNCRHRHESNLLLL